MQLLTLIQDMLSVVRMQMIHPELHVLEVPDLARGGGAADILEPFVNEVNPFAVIDFVVPEAGQVSSRRPASLGSTQRLLGMFALGDVFHDGDEMPGFAQRASHERDAQVDLRSELITFRPHGVQEQA
jgi:hypothetical protein